MADAKKSLVYGYHHVAWRAYDYDASLDFYTRALGCTMYRRWGTGDGRGCMLDIGNGNYLEILAGGTRPPRPEGLFIHLAVTTDDCDAAMQRAIDAGAEVYIAPKTLSLDSSPLPVSGRNGFIKGPDGELVEFFQEDTE